MTSAVYHGHKLREYIKPKNAFKGTNFLDF